MIFKTFDSDIDKISAKWGIFGKSFYDFAEASRNRKIAIDDLFTLGGVPLKDAKKQAGSFWSYLYPKKEDIQAQMIDVDSMIPKLDSNNFDFNKWINELNEVDKKVKAGKISWQDYSNGLKDNQKWIAKWGQETQGTIRTQEGLIKANQSARDAAIAHNAALEQQTLSAKAGQVALKGLAMAGNMIAMWAIGEIISLVATGISNYVNEFDNLKEKSESFSSSVSEFNSKIAEGTSQVEELSEKYYKLSEGVSNSGENISLTTDEYNEYKDTVSKLSDLLPNHTALINDQGEKIGFVGGKLKEANKEYKEYLKNQANDLINGNNENGVKFQDTLDNYEKAKDSNYTKANSSILRIDQYGGTAGKSIDLAGQLGIADPLKLYNTSGKLKVLESLVGKQKSEWQDVLYDSNFGDSVDANLVEKILGIDVDKVKNMTDEEFNSLQNTLNSSINNFKQELDGDAQDITSGLNTMLFASDYYDSIGSDSTKNNLSSIIQSMGTEALDELQKSGIDTQNTVAIQGWVENIAKEVSRDQFGLATAINGLFKLDADKMTPTDLQEQVDKYLTTIAAAFYGISEDKVTDEQKKAYRDKFFPNVEDDAKAYENSLKKLYTKKYGNTIRAATEDDKEKFEDWTSKNNVTQEELNSLDSRGYNLVTNSIEEFTSALKTLRKEAKETAEENKKSFSSIWGTLKDSEQKSLKKSVLAGTFDQEELDKYQTLANNFSLKKVREEILNTIALDDKIGQFLSDTDKLTTAYQEMQKNGVVSTKTLQGMPDGLRNLEGYTDFRNTVSSSKTSKADKKSSFESLITEYIQTNDTIKNVTSETRDYAINALKDIGVTNAEAIVDAQLEYNKLSKSFEKVTDEINDLNQKDVNNFLKACRSKNMSNVDLANMIGTNATKIVNGLSSEYETDVTNFISSVRQKLEAQNTLNEALLESWKLEAKVYKSTTKTSNAKNSSWFGSANGSDSRTLDPSDPNYTKWKEQADKVEKSRKKYEKAVKNNEKQLKKIQNDYKKQKAKFAKLKYNPTSSSNSNKKSGSKSSGTTNTNQIDWIERKLTVLSKKLDVAKSKYDALFATSKAKDSDTFVDQQNKALEEQIKIQDKVIAVNNKAEKSYSKIAKKYAKKISSTHKNLVQYGGYTIENFTTKDTTKKTKKSKKGTKKVKVTKNEYDNIQKYIEYLDKVSDAQSNKSKAQQEKVNLQIEQKQNSQTRAETKQSMYKAQEENASGLSKNNYIKDQITQLTKSYNLQIEIAKLQKDYDKAKQLEAEKQKQINQLRYHEVENIKTAYENQVSLLDAQEANIQSQVDLAEARGDIVSKAYYSSMSNIEKQKQSNYNDELNKLRAKQSNFATGSDEWYDLQKDIQDVVEKISGSEKAIVENTKAIGELNDKMYESIDATASNLDTEADFLAGLVPGETTDSDTGKLTDAGLAKLYAAGISYSAYQATAQKENARLKQIQDANKSGTLLEGYASLQAQKDAESTIAKAAQEANNSIKSHADEIVDLMKSAIDASMNYLQDIIDARKDLLNQEKELYDYQKQLLEKTKTVSSLQKQLYASSGDYSEEGRLKTAQLRQSLDEAQQDLQDTEYDKYISDQQEMLDNLMDEYKDLMEDLQKNENELLKQGITAINDNKIVMDNIFKKTASDYGYPTSSELDNARSALASGLISVMNSGDENSITSVIKAECDKIVQAYSKADGKSSSTTTTPQNPTQQGTGTGSVGGTAAQENAYAQQAKRMAEIESFKAWLKSISGSGMNKPLTKAKSGKKYSSDINKALSKYGYVVKNTKLSGGVKAIDDFARRLDPTITSGDGKFSKDGKAYQALKKKYGSLGFKTGGIGTLVKASGEDGIAMVRNGEGFISPENVKDIKDLMNLIPDITSFMTPKMDMGKYVDKLSPVNRTVNVDNITFELPNVKNTVDFTDTIKTPSQQKAFASAIGDAINGNRLNINRY